MFFFGEGLFTNTRTCEICKRTHTYEFFFDFPSAREILGTVSQRLARAVWCEPLAQPAPLEREHGVLLPPSPPSSSLARGGGSCFSCAWPPLIPARWMGERGKGVSGLKGYAFECRHTGGWLERRPTDINERPDFGREGSASAAAG